MINFVALALLSLSVLPYHATSPDLFQEYYPQAEQKLATLTTPQKLAQVLLVRYPDADGLAALAQHQFGGYVFFARDFAGKSAPEVQTLLASLQAVAKIPLLTAVDEEGGSVVRVSSNPQLAPAPFESPRAIYAAGGLPAIAADTAQKSALLQNLGLNLNLAPVVDVSTNSKDYMFRRSLGQDAQVTAEFARAVLQTSQIYNHEHSPAVGVSYTLKHFPGYGNNSDTHQGDSVDSRSLDSLIQRDLVPFQAGIAADAEAILVSHNTVTALDAGQPASLSGTIHQLLRQGLNFSGVIITDDIAMAALADDAQTTVQALLAGNDLIITSDYAASLDELATALAQGRLSPAQLDRAVKRVLAWKYAKNLLTE